MRGTASAPASSGNLGPGFDCLALALELRCTVAAEPCDVWTIEQDGRTVEGKADDLVVRAGEAAVGRPMRLEISNDIPRSRGLGSSSAVTAAAAAASLRSMGLPVDGDTLFEIVAELEGHPDNAAAAVHGGLMMATSGGTLRRLELAEDIQVLVAIPDYHLPTSQARAALPGVVDRAVATRSLARFGFLIEGLRTGDAGAFAAAAGDEMHEAPRAPLSPLTGALIEAARDAGALHACWSGAGPTALALVVPERRTAVAAALNDVAGDRGVVRALDVAVDGVR